MHIPIPEGVKKEINILSMKPKCLLNGQTIHICDHKWDGRSVHDVNDSSAAIHLDKEPNCGLSFHGKIRIPLQGEVSVEVPEEINKKLTRSQLKEIKEKLSKEIFEAFLDKNDDKITKENFINQIVHILSHDWRDKLSSKERAIDVATRLAQSFNLGGEINQFIKMQRNIMEAFTSHFSSQGKKYFITIQTDNILIGEISGKNKNKWT